ncbi:MAG: phosphotransferase [Candidatus Coatesbacteria bacterium]|nr:phosphotransferase [Candidatus Coatesbacteria bacterium]
MSQDYLRALPNHIRDVLSGIPGVRIEKLEGDVSTRRYFRLQFPENDAAHCLIDDCSEQASWQFERPYGFDANRRSVVAMLLPGESPARASRIIVDVTDYLARCGVPVPKVYLAIHEIGFLLIEDLGDIRLFELSAGMSKAELESAYLKMLEFIHLMQFPGPTIHRDCIAYSYGFTRERFLSELKLFVGAFSQLVLKRELLESEQAVVRSAFPVICMELMEQERAFTHRDFHSRNIMVWEGEYYVIDHQDARLGPLLYDVVSLLYDPYVTLDRESRQELSDYYLRGLPGRSRNSLRSIGISRSFDLCIVQRCLKAAGTYASVALNKKDASYLRFMPVAIWSALEASKRNGDLLELSNMLTHWLERAEELAASHPTRDHQHGVNFPENS